MSWINGSTKFRHWRHPSVLVISLFDDGVNGWKRLAGFNLKPPPPVLIDNFGQRSDRILEQLLAPEFSVIIPHAKPYLLASFGSFSRMDYGTGHETSFALFLLCLTLVRFFQPVEEEERDLVLTVFLRYLNLCWRLQDVYKLEPAGSHGVWGLDDYCFLPYIFGSGQLRGESFFSPYR